jgi:hypothetical protein
MQGAITGALFLNNAPDEQRRQGKHQNQKDTHLRPPPHLTRCDHRSYSSICAQVRGVRRVVARSTGVQPASGSFQPGQSWPVWST